MTADTDALRLVPAEPTEAMLKAACGVGPDTNNGCFSYDDARSVYVAMLAAAPAVQPAAGREEIARIIDKIEVVTGAHGPRIRPGEKARVTNAILAALAHPPAQASESGGEVKRFAVVNIGCIECGVSSDIVGTYDTRDEAERIAAACGKTLSWREGGQNEFEVFDLIAPQSEEYAAALSPGEGEQS